MAIKPIVGMTPTHGIELHYDFGQIWWAKFIAQEQLVFSFLTQVDPISSWTLQQLGHNNLYLWRQLLPSYLCQLNGYYIYI